jgi:hypothetical protein
MSIVITAEQRDALYDEILVGLSGIDAVWLAVEARNYRTAARLSQRYSDDLRFIVDDLGWGDGPGGAIELSTPPDVLRRVFSRLHDMIAGQTACAEEEWVEAQRQERQSRLVAEACRHVLVALDKGPGAEFNAN